MSFRPRSLLVAAVALGMAGAMGMHQNVVAAPTVEVSAPPRPNPKKKKRSRIGKFVRRWLPRPTPFPIHPNESARRDDGKPHQGSRECARRRRDWTLVSVIDASKRYPFGINHRLASMLRPDRVEVEFAAPEPGRIQLLR